MEGWVAAVEDTQRRHGRPVTGRLVKDREDRGILYVSPVAERGGGEIVLLKLASSIRKRGYRPIVVLLSTGPLAAEMRARGIRTYVFPSGRFRGPHRLLAVLWHLRRLIQRYQISLVQSGSGKSHLYGGFAAALARIPAILLVQEYIAPSDQWARAAELVPTAAVIAYSQGSLGIYTRSRRFPRQAVAYPGVEPAMLSDTSEGALAALREELCIPTGVSVVTMVGRLQPGKGQHVFLEAAAMVLRQQSNAHFLVVGSALLSQDSDYPATLTAMVAHDGIARNVTFTGQRGDITRILAMTDVVVHASTEGESFGQVIVEGMAQCKAVVASAAGGPLEIIDDGRDGLLTPPGDAAALAEAILTLLDDPARRARLGEAAKLTVECRFTVQRMTDDFARVYDDVLADHAYRQLGGK